MSSALTILTIGSCEVHVHELASEDGLSTLPPIANVIRGGPRTQQLDDRIRLVQPIRTAAGLIEPTIAFLVHLRWYPLRIWLHEPTHRIAVTDGDELLLADYRAATQCVLDIRPRISMPIIDARLLDDGSLLLLTEVEYVRFSNAGYVDYHRELDCAGGWDIIGQDVFVTLWDATRVQVDTLPQRCTASGTQGPQAS
jgi:hypothetical protein